MAAGDGQFITVGTSGAILGDAAPTKTTSGFAKLTPSQAILFGNTTVITLDGTVSPATGGVYPAKGETITVTINGNAQATTITDGTGDFHLTYNLSGILARGTPYPITYYYAGDALLSPATDNSTALTVNACTAPVAGPIGLGHLRRPDAFCAGGHSVAE